jgi:hypothetical protein
VTWAIALYDKGSRDLLGPTILRAMPKQDRPSIREDDIESRTI